MTEVSSCPEAEISPPEPPGVYSGADWAAPKTVLFWMIPHQPRSWGVPVFRTAGVGDNAHPTASDLTQHALAQPRTALKV